MNHPSRLPRLRRFLAVAMFVFALASLVWLTGKPSAAQTTQETPLPNSPAAVAQRAKALRPTVSSAAQHDVSPPLREIAPLGPTAQAEVQPFFALPKAAKSTAYGPQEAGTEASPGLLAGLNSASIPGPLITFDGVNNLNGVLPPDTVGDVGPNHYVQMVNLSFAIFDKQGNTLYGPANTNTLWSGFGGVCQTMNDGDPIVLYDQMADRWMMSQFALDFPDNFHECIAISETPDPTGAWYRYDFKISATKMNDYPHFGIWPDGYYMAVNQFGGADSSWQGQGVVAFERAQMLQGLPARMVYFDLYGVSDLLGGMLPSDWDGMTPPPAGAPNPYIMIDDDTWDASYPVDQLEVWQFHVDWSNLAASSFTGPTILPTQSPFDTDVVNAPQPGTSVRLDAIADRLMNRLQYRNFGDHQSLVVNHTVDIGGRAGIRWYELRNIGGSWQIYQEGTYGPDSNYRWMGSMAMDGSGNIALGYSVSSSSLFPSIRYTARTGTDPLGTLSANEQEIKAGTGSQTHSAARWGDYSQMSVDPVDDCTFWYTTEYIATTGSAPWRTHIGSFRLPDCAGAETGTLAGTITDAGSGDPVRNAQIRANQFNTTSDAAGQYALITPVASYTVTVSAYGYEEMTFANVEVTQGVTTPLDASLTKIPLVSVQGMVADGSGAGWPVYAEITIQGYPNSPIFSDPLTGHFAVDLLAGIPTTFTVKSILPGYLPQTRTILPVTDHPAEDFTLLVDATTCAAPGYTVDNGGGLFETFGGLTDDQPPVGWSVVDNIGNGQVWKFTDPGGRGNLTAGQGNFATVDSDDYEGDGVQDTELRTPVMDFTGQPEVRVVYNSLYRTYLINDTTDIANVDVSLDSGGTWTTVYTHTAEISEAERVNLDISALAANQPTVQVRFHYFDAHYEWYWQVDDVLVGLQTCKPTGEGLAVGHVYDANTGQAVNGATVSDGNGRQTVTVDTPLNFDLDGGFYLMPLASGSYTLTAAAAQYGEASQPITISELAISHLNLHMPAGRLAVADSVVLTLPINGPIQVVNVPLSNIGALDASFTLLTVEGAQQPPTPALAYASHKRKFPSKLLNDANAVNVYTHSAPVVPTLAGGSLRGYWDSGLETPWGIAYDSDTDSLWLNDRTTERAAAFGPDGAAMTPTADLSGWVTAFAADMAYDPVTRQVWAWNVGGDDCLHAFDAATGANLADRICPDFTVPQRGLAYNPLRDTFFSGSWNNEIVYEFNRQGQVVSAANLGLAISGLAYNPSTDHLFVLTNADSGHDLYVVDVTGSGPGGYAILGGFDIPGLTGWDQAGLALDCDGNLWAVDQVAGTVLQVESGETDACAWAASEWLTVTPTAGNVTAGGQEELTFTFNPQVLRPGVALGAVRMSTNTPYGVFSIPVTLTISHVYGVALAESTQDRAGQPGEVVTYTITVQNSGTITDSFDLALSGNAWATAATTTVGPVGVRGSATVVVSVTIPGDAAPGTRDTVTIALASHTDPTAKTQGSLTTTAGSFAVALSPATADGSADPGAIINYSVTITNQGTVTDSFVLSKAGNIWQTTMPAAVGPLAPGASAALTVTVLVPAGTTAGSTNNSTITATSITDKIRSASILLRSTAKTMHRVRMSSADVMGKTGVPGTQVEYSLLITNTGNLAESFTLGLVGHNWTVSGPAQVGPLAANTGSATVKVRVLVAADAAAGATDPLTVTVTSPADAGATAQLLLTTTAGTLHAAALDAPDAFIGAPGESLTATVTATNTGNISDAYTVTVSGGDWPVQFSDQVAVLEPGESAPISIRVDIPLAILPNASRSWTVNLISQTTGQVKATTTLKVATQGGGYSLFLPDLLR